jgi:homogentisate 1,2-dioxygenase
VKFTAGLAFMFETTYMLKLTDWAVSAPHLERDYVDCWGGLPKLFQPPSDAEAAAGAQEGGGEQASS